MVTMVVKKTSYRWLSEDLSCIECFYDSFLCCFIRLFLMPLGFVYFHCMEEQHEHSAKHLPSPPDKVI